MSCSLSCAGFRKSSLNRTMLSLTATLKRQLPGRRLHFFHFFFFLDTHDLRMARSDTNAHTRNVRTSTHRKSDTHFNRGSHCEHFIQSVTDAAALRPHAAQRGRISLCVCVDFHYSTRFFLPRKQPGHRQSSSLRPFRFTFT